MFDPDRLAKMTKICRGYGLISKEHNGDYLTKNEIQERVAQGLDCINIAPEFGVMQTKLLLDTVFSKVDVEKAYEACEKSKKYVKWIPEELRSNPPRILVIEVSGHYVFTQVPFSPSMKYITQSFRSLLHKRFDEIISCWN